MKIVEFRLAMPLTLEEYKLCQLYLVAKASLEDSEKSTSNCTDKNEVESKKGIVILKNESYCSEEGITGQYTHKRINLVNKLPKWMFHFLDTKYCILDEQSWNCYPYLKTVYESSGFPKAKVQVESAHHVGFNTEENALNLSDDLLSLRKVIFVDIVNDKLSSKEYNAKEDPSLFYSEKAKRGRLTKSWKEESPFIMTCYKVFTIHIPYFGLFGSKIENWVISYLKDNILKYHRKAFCWIDEWYGLTIEDIRNLEKEVQKKLDTFWKQVEGVSVGVEETKIEQKDEESVLKNVDEQTEISGKIDLLGNHTSNNGEENREANICYNDFKNNSNDQTAPLETEGIVNKIEENFEEKTRQISEKSKHFKSASFEEVPLEKGNYISSKTDTHNESQIYSQRNSEIYSTEIQPKSHTRESQSIRIDTSVGISEKGERLNSFKENTVQSIKRDEEDNSFFFFQKSKLHGEYGEYLYRLNDGMFNSWRHRYVIIQDNKLLCYLDDTKSVFKGEIDILNAQIQWIGEYKGRSSVFVIHSCSKNVVYISAENDFETKRCMIDVQMATLLKKETPVDTNLHAGESTKLEKMFGEKSVDIRNRLSIQSKKSGSIFSEENANYTSKKSSIGFNQNEYKIVEGNEEQRKENKTRKTISTREKRKKDKNMISSKKKKENIELIKKNDNINKENSGKSSNSSDHKVTKDFLVKNRMNENDNMSRMNNSIKGNIKNTKNVFGFQKEPETFLKKLYFNLKTKKSETIYKFLKNLSDKKIECCSKLIPNNKICEDNEHYKNVETSELRLKESTVFNLMQNLNVETSQWSSDAMNELKMNLQKLEFEKMFQKGKINLLDNLFHLCSIVSLIYSFIHLYMYVTYVFYLLMIFIFICVLMHFEEKNNSVNLVNKVYKCTTQVSIPLNSLMVYLMSDEKYFREDKKEMFKTRSGKMCYVISSFQPYFQNFFLHMLSFFLKTRNAYSTIGFYEMTKKKEESGEEKGEAIQEKGRHIPEVCYVILQRTDKSVKRYFQLMNKWGEIDVEEGKEERKKGETRKNATLFDTSFEKKFTNTCDYINVEENNEKSKEILEDVFQDIDSVYWNKYVNDNNNENNCLLKSINGGSTGRPLSVNLNGMIEELNKVKESKTFENFYENTKEKNPTLLSFFLLNFIKLGNFLKKILFKKHVNIKGFDIFVIKEKGLNLCEITFFTSYNYGSYFLNKIMNKLRCSTIYSLPILIKQCNLFNFEKDIGAKENEELLIREEYEKEQTGKDNIRKRSTHSCEKHIISLLEKKRVEKNVCTKLLCDGLNEDASENIIIHMYNLIYAEYLKSETFVNLIKNVDESFFIINFTKTFLYIIENMRVHNIKQVKMETEYLKNEKSSVDYIDDLFIYNVFTLLKALKLFFFTFANSFVFPKKNETFQCFFGNSKISTAMKSIKPLLFSTTAKNLKSKGKMICNFSMDPIWKFDEIRIFIENSTHIKNKNYQINFRYPSISVKNILSGELSFTLFGELTVEDSLRSRAEIQFMEQAESNGQFFGIIRRKNLVTDVLSGNIFDKIVLNDDKSFKVMEQIRMHIIPNEEDNSSAT